jgi:hypothetical protein
MATKSQQKDDVSAAKTDTTITPTPLTKSIHYLKQRLQDKEKRILLDCRGEDKTWGHADVTKFNNKHADLWKCASMSVYVKDTEELVFTHAKQKEKKKKYKVYKTILELKRPVEEVLNVLYDIDKIKSWNDSIVESTALISEKELERLAPSTVKSQDKYDLVYNRIKEYTGLDSHDFVMIRRLAILSAKSWLISSMSVDPSNLQQIATSLNHAAWTTTPNKVQRGFANPGGFLIEAHANQTTRITWFMNIYCHIPVGPLGMAISETFTKKEIRKLVEQLLSHLAKPIENKGNVANIVKK